MKNRLVVIDLDGTLVDRNGQIAKEDKAAVARLVQSFVPVALCTGRILQTTVPFITELNLEASHHIMFDGALIYAPLGRATLFRKPLQSDVVRESVEYCRNEGIHLELYSRDAFFTECENWSDGIHRNFFRVEPTFAVFDGIWDREAILKAEMVVGSPEDAQKAKGFADHFNGRLNFSVAHTPAYPEVEFLNITHPEVSKGAALRHMVDMLGIYTPEIIAIGDGLNDISLFKEVGHAVAMGDAPDEVKQVCQYIVADVEHHGVAEAINYFFPV
ncbi:MAG: Cof-type HAD-IIB family hydrolase [Dehalococcoidia bacterium]|nr:Cof-type HAD-IIB family hydrolase [Dehalococcoidia bacterium]